LLREILCWKEKTKRYNVKVIYDMCIYFSVHSHFLKYLIDNISDVIGLLCSISALQKITIIKNSSNPRMKDIREIEILLFR
jgi:hypothetical protein